MADQKVFRTLRVGDPSLNIVGSAHVVVRLTDGMLKVTVDNLRAVNVIIEPGCTVRLSDERGKYARDS